MTLPHFMCWQLPRADNQLLNVRSRPFDCSSNLAASGLLSSVRESAPLQKQLQFSHTLPCWKRSQAWQQTGRCFAAILGFMEPGHVMVQVQRYHLTVKDVLTDSR